MKQWLAAFVLLLTAPLAFSQMPSTCVAGTNIYYISSSRGSDSNTQAQARNASKATPWAHQPYMHNFTGTYSHTAGDCFVFLGNDTWPAASFVLHITASGTSSAIDYYGVDTTWFSGASFGQPKFDLGQAFPGANNHIVDTAGASGSGGTNGAGIPGLPYITFDNIAILNANRHLTGSNVDNTGLMVFGGQHSSAMATGVTVENMTLADWMSTENITGTADFSYGVIYGASVVKNTTISDQNGFAFIGGTKTLGWSSGGCVGCGEFGPGNLTHHAWVECSSCTTVHDNEMYNIDATSLAGPGGIHTHIIYQDGGGTPATNPHDTTAVYNNYLHNSTASLVISVCYNTAVYNNLVDTASGNVSVELNLCQDDSSSALGLVTNNTFNTGSNVFNESCYRTPSATPGKGTIHIQNNLCIPSSGSAGGVNITTQVISNNTTTTLAAANAAGYTSANKFQGTSLTTKNGVNLTSFCTSQPAMCLDASGAPWRNSVYNPRPAGSTAWDQTLYQSGSPTPAVTVTAPTAGSTVSGSVTITVTAVGGTISSIQPLLDGSPFGASCKTSPCSVVWDTTKSANGSHTVGGTATSGTGTFNATPISVTVSNSAPGCTTSAPTWTNTSFTAQTGSFTATLTVTPNGIPPSGSGGPIVGLAQNPVSAYNQNSSLIRQSDNGFWEVFNGTTGAYAHDASVSWVPGTAASFTWIVNVAAQTATVQVTQSAVTTTIANSYAFRATSTSLGFWTLDPETAPTTLQVCSFALGANGVMAPTSFNFGSVLIGQTPTQGFTLTNNGGTSLSWSAFNITGGVFTISSNSCTSPLAAGASCPFTVQYAPVAATTSTGTVSLTTGGTVNSVSLSGTGLAVAAPSTPTGLTATPSQSNINLAWTASTGGAPITYNVGRATVSGGPYTTIASGVTVTSYTDVSLANGTYYYVVSATNTGGTSGNSTQASATIASNPTINFTPATLAFGTVPFSSTTQQSLQVSNVGTATLTLNSSSAVTITGANAADFSVDASSACGNSTSVPVGSSCVIVVDFVPSLSAQETAAVCVASNSPTTPDCVTMTGNGGPATFVNPTSVNFGNVYNNHTAATQTVTFFNQSGATVTFSSIALTTGTVFTISGNTCGSSVATSASCVITLSFTPTAPGPVTDTLTFTSSAPNSPIVVPISGNGNAHKVKKGVTM